MGDVTAAREAWARQDWQACFDAASSTDDDDPERLDLLAESAWWLGRLDVCIASRERAYHLFEAAGDDRRAGQCAVWLYEHHCFRASPAIASGWLGRARRALERGADCIELGALVLREAEVAHGAGDLERAADLCRRGVELGRELRCNDLEAEALQALGRIRIDQGRPGEGLALLDEAMLFAIEGRLSPYSTGKVYCSLVTACDQLSDHRRAAEWNEATTDWATRHSLSVFPGLCRVHLAMHLEARGEWVEAEREAVRASEELSTINLPNAAAAWAEIGDIRRRIGDLSGAADAFARADELCPSPRAGMALLRLAEGDLGAASSVVAEALEGAGWNRLARAKVLPALTQISIAAGDVAMAAGAAEELEAIAEDFDSAGLRAAALSSRGRVLLASRDASSSSFSEAATTLRAAVALWTELAIPYEIATARMLLGEAHRLAGDDAAAAVAFSAARADFDTMGVKLADPPADAGASPSPAVSLSVSLPCGLTEREAEVLRHVAVGKTNKEIAAALYLSEKTVARHLSNIFTKIAVPTRAAATAFAYSQGIVGGAAGGESA